MDSGTKIRKVGIRERYKTTFCRLAVIRISILVNDVTKITRRSGSILNYGSDEGFLGSLRAVFGSVSISVVHEGRENLTFYLILGFHTLIDTFHGIKRKSKVIFRENF